MDTFILKTLFIIYYFSWDESIIPILLEVEKVITTDINLPSHHNECIIPHKIEIQVTLNIKFLSYS